MISIANLRLQRDILTYFEYLKKTFKDYQNFLRNAEMFFKGGEIAGRNKEELVYDSNIEGYPKLSYDELNQKREKIPKEIPELINISPAINVVLSLIDMGTIKTGIVWLKEALAELEALFSCPPKGVEAWLEEVNP